LNAEMAAACSAGEQIWSTISSWVIGPGRPCPV
jgi:hypothetical protein